MPEEDYVTPIVVALIGGVITIGITLAGTYAMRKYVDRKLAQLPPLKKR